MSEYIFLFDMDSTITQKEVLPEVSKRIGRLQKLQCVEKFHSERVSLIE